MTPIARRAALAVLAIVVAAPFFVATTFIGDDYLFLSFARHAPNPLAPFVSDHHGGEYYRPLPMLVWWLLGRPAAGSVPFAALAGDDLDEPALDASAFDRTGHWSTLPTDWRGIPDERVTSQETLAVIGRAIDALPPMQAEVIRLRDVLGWTSEEVRNALGLTDTNQRVLLHRARAKVRAAIEEHLRSVRG